MADRPIAIVPEDSLLPTGGCALAALASGNEAVGTATYFDQLFLLQFPPPWTRVAANAPGFPQEMRIHLATLARAGIVGHSLLIDGGAPLPSGSWRLLHYRKSDGESGPLCVGREFIVPFNQLEALLSDLAVDPASASAFDVGLKTRDLFVCTHGERDGCCGVFGDQAFEYIRNNHADEHLRVWRTSHFGGHRFAPTLVDLPDGCSWAWLDPPSIDSIIDRTGPTEGLIKKYRGLNSLPSQLQCAERELFAEFGWRWRDAKVIAHLETGSNGEIIATLDFRMPDGTTGTRSFLIEEQVGVPAPASCGAEAKAPTCFSCRPLLSEAA